jgi:hypothetical protein
LLFSDVVWVGWFGRPALFASVLFVGEPQIPSVVFTLFRWVNVLALDALQADRSIKSVIKLVVF